MRFWPMPGDADGRDMSPIEAYPLAPLWRCLLRVIIVGALPGGQTLRARRNHARNVLPRPDASCAPAIFRIVKPNISDHQSGNQSVHSHLGDALWIAARLCYS